MSKAPGDRMVFLVGLAVPIGLGMAFAAQGLIFLIHLITNFAFYGRLSWQGASPADNSLGWWVLLVPAAGGVVIGLMARYGSKAIRGHGIPEAMERVLQNESRIPFRLTWLKPLSAAISIGTGGPFGAEGPIIATGGAAGSALGQILSTTAMERKTLLAAGAAAGMAATFGSPLSAVLLAIELLLFEFKPRSFVPVAMASTMAATVRLGFVGAEPIFPMPALAPPALPAFLALAVVGGLAGGLAVGVTKAVYFVEDCFERLPVPWMWWPALGGLAVGFIGYFEPRTLGVGYDNISAILEGTIPAAAVLIFCSLKFLSWSAALGSGTSGGHLGSAAHGGKWIGAGRRGLSAKISARPAGGSGHGGPGGNGLPLRRSFPGHPGLGGLCLGNHRTGKCLPASAGRLRDGAARFPPAGEKFHHDRKNFAARGHRSF